MPNAQPVQWTILHRTLLAGLISLTGAGNAYCAVPIDESKLPAPSSAQIDFARDIQPIFEQSCLKCHGPEKPKGKFRLDNRVSALEGGENGVAIISGQSGNSPLIHYVAGLVEDMEMPPPGKAPPVSQEQIGLLRAWIDQGAVWPDETEAEPKVRYSMSPSVRWIRVSGDEHQFREHSWMREGWAGGVEQIEMVEKDGDKFIRIEGRAITDEYKILLTAGQTDSGFVRFGWEQYRKYYDDSGGYYPGFDPSQFRLDRDLHLDIGRVWADFGITLPDWPRMVLGYEYQYRDGEKSTLEWGTVTQGLELDGTARKRNIFPASKAIDERTHIIKFDLDHDIGGVHVEERFRGEFGEMKTERVNRQPSTTSANGTTQISTVKESYNHFEGANTFRVEKQFKDWLYGSFGHLYSQLNSDAVFDLDPVLIPANRWSTEKIVLDQKTHALNLSGQLGPFDGLTISGGVMGEWMRQEGFGSANHDIVITPTFVIPRFTLFDQNIDKGLLEERVGLRYAKIPFTILFGEARLQQESAGEFEEEIGGDRPFRRDTDLTSALQDFRAGFNTSPWRWMSLNAHYRHYQKKTDYDHLVDQFLIGNPGDAIIVDPPVGFAQGYPAFLRSLNRKTDEVEARLVLRPVNWLRTTLSYKIIGTDFVTVTDPATSATPNDRSMGGRIRDANYDASIYSVNFTLTPWQRLYLSTTLSYEQSRTLTADNGSPSVVPYRGDIYSVLASANYTLNAKTDLRATYSFSHAAYGQDNFADGLPVGKDYQQHGIRAGLTRRFNKHLSTALQYGFYLYDEPSSGHLNDYTAHAVFGTLTWILP